MWVWSGIGKHKGKDFAATGSIFGGGELHKRVSEIDNKISIATVYRTVKLFEESGIVEKHDFKGGKARYEQSPEEHHDHLIDINSGEIVEFVDKDIEKLQNEVAKKLGYKLVDHKLELYGSKIKK